MNDYKEIWQSFIKSISSHKNLKDLIKKLDSGKATYEEAQKYSSSLANYLVDFLSAENPTNAEQILETLKDRSICKNFFKEIDDYTYSMQKTLNEVNNLGINAVKVTSPRELIDSNVSLSDDYEKDISNLASKVELNANKHVDTVQQANARFQSDANYSITVSRTYDGKGLSDGRTCKWCLSRVGHNVPYNEAYKRGMFQRHEGCHCIIEYNNNGNKTYQTTKGGRNSWQLVQEQENEEENSEFERKRRIAKAKGEPYDATDEWLHKPNNKKGKTYISDSVTVNGEKYVVDGKYVVQDHNETEKKIANMIAEKTGKNVKLLPRVNFPLGVKTADYEIDNEFWDLKTIEGKTKNTLCNAIKSKKEQSNNFVFELTTDGLSPKQAIENLENVIFKYDRYSFAKKVMVVDKEKIYKVFEK